MNMQCIAISGVESFFQLLGVLLIFILVLAATYFTTKWVAGFQKSQSFNHNLHVVETLKITTNKYVQIIKAGDKYVLIAIGKDEITKLAELDADEIDEVNESGKDIQISSESFKQILEKVKDKIPSNKDKDENKEV